ncbi:hypothetical protein SUGI_0307160 [Cryptomeria japonica]|nr:hypothetical protein SUGI_0307160 [Cryptomeria japonica]
MDGDDPFQIDSFILKFDGYHTGQMDNGNSKLLDLSSALLQDPPPTAPKSRSRVAQSDNKTENSRGWN